MVRRVFGYVDEEDVSGRRSKSPLKVWPSYESLCHLLFTKGHTEGEWHKVEVHHHQSLEKCKIKAKGHTTYQRGSQRDLKDGLCQVWVGMQGDRDPHSLLARVWM